MPRQPRLDAPGTLHHVMGRGIERGKIFHNEVDRTDFLNRVADLCQGGALIVYAWVVMDNHFHILVRTGREPLAQGMRRLLTGYVVNFNRRHKRYGHLFQNRYKSIVCEEEPYLLELTRYIHLNPMRAVVVGSVGGLSRYPWSGHSVIMGKVKREWQDTETVLGHFGKKKKEAIRKYERYVEEGVSQGRRPELVGGGLIRSVGGWAQVVSLRRRGEKVVTDARILGSSEFTEEVIAEAEVREKETLRLSGKVSGIDEVARVIMEAEGIQEGELRAGSRKRAVVGARKVLCQLAVKRMGFSGAAVARFLGVTTSAVNRLANAPELPELASFIKLF